MHGIRANLSGVEWRLAFSPGTENGPGAKTSQERQNRETEAKALAAKMSQKVDGQVPTQPGKDRSNDIKI